MNVCFFNSMFQWIYVSNRQMIGTYLIVLKSSSYKVKKKINNLKKGKQIGERHI
jgi:hypothetical protein